MATPKGKKHTHDWIARRFIEEHEDKPSLNFLYVNSEDIFYVYNKGVWTPMTDDQVYRKVHIFTLGLKNADTNPMALTQNITASIIRDVVNHIKVLLPHQTPNIESKFLTFNDGKSLDLSVTPFKIHPSARNQYSTQFVDAPHTITFPHHTRTPKKWLKFLSQIMIDSHGNPDKVLMNYVQEVFGYTLLQTNEAQQAFFFYGSGANGKSVMLHIMRAMFPSPLVSACTLQALTNNRFMLANLRAKRLNIANEDESKFIKSDMFKQIISGEQVTAERKFEKPVEFEPLIVLIFACNKMPKLDGIEFALRRRIRIIPCLAQIPIDKQNPNLINELMEELPEIIAWAIQGAERIKKRNFKFIEPRSMDKVMRQFEIGQSSVAEFMFENFQFTNSEEDVILRSNLYNGYQQWCEDTGRKPLGRNNFLQEVKQRFQQEGMIFPDNSIRVPQLGDTQHRVVLGTKRTDDTTAWIYENPSIFNSNANPTI